MLVYAYWALRYCSPLALVRSYRYGGSGLEVFILTLGRGMHIHVSGHINSPLTFLCISGVYLVDNCIQNFHLGMYIVGYTAGNLVFFSKT